MTMALGELPPLGESLVQQEYIPEPETTPAGLGWQGRLDQAMTREDVVGVARDYMALWSPNELSCLPANLRPGKLVDSDDVSDCALRFIQAEMGRGTEAETHVGKLRAFFSRA